MGTGEAFEVKKEAYLQGKAKATSRGTRRLNDRDFASGELGS